MAKLTNRIDRLSPAQESKLPEWRDKWLKIGLSTDPIDRAEVKKACDMAYRCAGLELPGLLVCMPDPVQGAVAGAILSQVGAQVRDQVWAQVGDQVRDQVGAQVLAQVGDQVRDQVGAQVWAQVGAQVWVQVWDQVGEQVRGYIYGNHDAAWLGFYDYFDRVAGVAAPKVYGLMALVKCCGWVIPYQNAVIAVDRPREIHLFGGRLHRDGGGAVVYRSGWSVWALNGVRVPQWLAETKAEELDAKKFAEIDNVEVRREFVLKIGVERLIHKLGAKSLHKQGDYELLSVDLGEGVGEWPYLKMLNPSIGTWHVECVGRACRTVQQALNFRASQMKSLNGADWKPEVLT